MKIWPGFWLFHMLHGIAHLDSGMDEAVSTMRCRTCRLDLRYIPGRACPECGTAFDSDDPSTLYPLYTQRLALQSKRWVLKWCVWIPSLGSYGFSLFLWVVIAPRNPDLSFADRVFGTPIVALIYGVPLAGMVVPFTLGLYLIYGLIVTVLDRKHSRQAAAPR